MSISTAPQTDDTAVPDDPALPSITTLPEGSLACELCGVAVSGPHRPEDIQTAVATDRIGPMINQVTPIYPHTTDLTRCDVCRGLVAHADEIIDAHPRVRGMIGSRSIVLHRITAALCALDVIGQTPAEGALRLDRALWLLLEKMTPVGAPLAFSRRLAPTIQRKVRSDDCSTAPWSHLTGVDRQMVRDAFGALLRARTEQPRPVPCPSGGCMLCGLGSVRAKPSVAHEVWTEESATPRLLGGDQSPTRIEGHTCPECSAAILEARSIGRTAMEGALRKFLGLRRYSISVDPIDGLIAWGALPSHQRRPSARPWAHVGDRDQLAATLS